MAKTARALAGRDPVRRTLVALAAIATMAALVGVMAASGSAAPGDTTRVSVGSSGDQGNNRSNDPSISPDGRFVAFESDAFNLVVDDFNWVPDIFVRDLQGGTLERVSVNSSGVEGNAQSDRPSISADGRYVAFESSASNLVSGDTGSFDVFVRDRQNQTTERVSVDSSGGQADSSSGSPSISADGRYVAFQSEASDLVTGDSNGSTDVFVHDRDLETTTTERVSVDSSGDEAGSSSGLTSISADGRYVAFESAASDLVSGDSNDVDDVFVRDRELETTELVSVNTSGDEGNSFSNNPSISPEGRYVAFRSDASDLVSGDPRSGHGDVFVRDRDLETTELVSVDNSGAEGDLSSHAPSVSSKGRYVAFQSDATNLVSDDLNKKHDIFVRDRDLETTERVSVASSGAEGNQNSQNPSVTPDGRHIAFESEASDLVAGDSNGSYDIFVHERSIVPSDPTSTPPDTTITNGPAEDSVVNSKQVGFQFTSSEEGSTFECSIDGQADFSPCPSPEGAPGQVYRDLAEGSHTFEVKATDADGNTDPTPASRTWTVDTTAPTVQSATPADGAPKVSLKNPGITADFSEKMAFENGQPSTSFKLETVTVKGSRVTPISTVATTVQNPAPSQMDGTIVGLKPDADLAKATNYQVTITTSATDLAGNPLQIAKVWRFKTAPK